MKLSQKQDMTKKRGPKKSMEGRITLRLTAAQRRSLDAEARRIGCSLSILCRALMMDGYELAKNAVPDDSPAYVKLCQVCQKKRKSVAKVSPAKKKPVRKKPAKK